MDRIKITREEDRLTLAAILIKNGYTVTVRKVKRASGKAYDCYVEYSETEAE